MEIKESEGLDILGSFLAKWVQIERLLTEIATKNLERISTKSKYILAERGGLSADVSRELAHSNIISQSLSSNIEDLRLVRNKTIHGHNDYKNIITKEIITRAELIIQDLVKNVNSN